MSVIDVVQQRFALNAIGKVEYRYQARILGKKTGWWIWIQQRTVDAALIVAMFLVLLSMASILFNTDISPFINSIPLLVIFPPIVAVVIHFGLLTRTTILSSNSISRERQQQSWELLILTGVDAEHIVLGKWMATIRSLWPAFLRLGILRASVVVFLGSYLNGPTSYGNLSYFSGDYQIFVPTILHFGIAMLFVFLVTAANLLFTAACGVAASARHQRAGVSLARGFGIRLAIIGLMVGGTLMIGFFLSRIFFDLSLPDFIGQLLTTLFAAFASMLDNGALLGANLVFTRIQYGESPVNSQVYLVVAMAGLLVIYLGLSRVLLGGTIRHLIRQGVLPAKA